MAMVLAAVVMAGAAVSCEPIDNNEDQTEQDGDQTGNEDGGQNEGTGNEGETNTLTLDGKQWLAIIPAEDETTTDSGYCFDFGVTVENKSIVWNVSLSNYKFTAGAAEMAGEYVITATNATSGTISVVEWGMMTSEYMYKELTATSVKIHASCLNYGAGPDEYLDFEIPAQVITVQ